MKYVHERVFQKLTFLRVDFQKTFYQRGAENSGSTHFFKLVFWYLTADFVFFSYL